MNFSLQVHIDLVLPCGQPPQQDCSPYMDDGLGSPSCSSGEALPTLPAPRLPARTRNWPRRRAPEHCVLGHGGAPLAAARSLSKDDLRISLGSAAQRESGGGSETDNGVAAAWLLGDRRPSSRGTLRHLRLRKSHDYSALLVPVAAAATPHFSVLPAAIKWSPLTRLRSPLPPPALSPASDFADGLLGRGSPWRQSVLGPLTSFNIGATPAASRASPSSCGIGGIGRLRLGASPAPPSAGAAAGVDARARGTARPPLSQQSRWGGGTTAGQGPMLGGKQGASVEVRGTVAADSRVTCRAGEARDGVQAIRGGGCRGGDTRCGSLRNAALLVLAGVVAAAAGVWVDTLSAARDGGAVDAVSKPLRCGRGGGWDEVAGPGLAGGWNGLGGGDYDYGAAAAVGNVCGGGRGGAWPGRLEATMGSGGRGWAEGNVGQGKEYVRSKRTSKVKEGCGGGVLQGGGVGEREEETAGEAVQRVFAAVA